MGEHIFTPMKGTKFTKLNLPMKLTNLLIKSFASFMRSWTVAHEDAKTMAEHRKILTIQMGVYNTYWQT